MSVPLSILDLTTISEGSTAREAISASMETAKLADDLGYKRLWFAEHHNTPAIASSATSLLISQAASITKNIRVGSGGVMLPNHSPLMVAEHYGTLVNMHGDRIDLGIGRAPGTDRLTAHALNRSSVEPQEFAQSIYDLQGWFSETGKSHSLNILSSVSQGTNLPIWILGSTINGASLAGQLGLPFAVASHFSPENIEQAIKTYREMFRSDVATAQIDEPYVMAGVNVMAAESNEVAQQEFTVVEQMFLAVQRGVTTKIQPPISPQELQSKGGSSSMLRIKAVGDAEQVKDQLETFVDTYGVDELIIATYSFDPEVRNQSLKLLADAWF